jgi:hypothetical protein
MSNFCKVVKSTVGSTLQRAGGAPATVEDIDGTSCVVLFGDVQVILTEDKRDRSVTANLVFMDNPERELQGYIAGRAFGIEWNDQSKYASVEAKISAELRDVERLLEAIKSSAVTSKEIGFFNKGYNCGYTDALS